MDFCDGGDLQTKINDRKKSQNYMKETEIW